MTHAPTIKHYLTRVTVALVAIGALGLGNLSKPALATPTNTVFDRVIDGCTFEFLYGNFYSVPYAKVRIASADPAGWDCWAKHVTVYWTDGTSNSQSDLDAGFLQEWHTVGTWHQINGPSGRTAYGASWFQGADKNNTSCTDAWTLDARFNDGDPEGYWSFHDYSC